ncbi:choice-of-anchor M domain-containing protein [Corynebacterium aquatimens]|uniref:Surface-anchored protein n=1 Tax=Corynebacterium aquatimens TaxID=1190508 RepID=A0A931DVR2_9CORY|nr:choice-of-anchor M domain-containing protein [Corynebacterium aquatimens]MBG6122409.1 surface-anchored protein [Corynebacterium aquatimens]WJY65051.1 hypothetical protein CAQUA_01580 [Corynebacterium aquatimens]
MNSQNRRQNNRTLRAIRGVVKNVVAANAVAVALGLGSAGIAQAQGESNDPALQQRVNADEKIAPLGEKVVISEGHADLGPVYVNGKLNFMVRDDSQAPPVWRHIDDVVFAVSDKAISDNAVSDNAIQTLPEADELSFTGAKPGAKVWVVPQTEVAGVPWLGWTVQSPAVVDKSERGVNIAFGGHQGPGDFSLFLHDGGSSQPQQLWNSRLSGHQPMWVEADTHTHANWVFTEPGVHLVAVQFLLKEHSGLTTLHQNVIRFAVGDSTNPAQARAATFDDPWRTASTGAAEADGGAEHDGAAATEDTQSGSGVMWTFVGLVVFALILGVGSLVTLKRARARARREQRLDRQQG